MRRSFVLVVVFVVVCSSVWSFGSHFDDWRLIIARVSEMHVAYHRWNGVFGIFTSAEQTTFNISKTLQYLSFFPSFLTCIVKCVCEGEDEGGGVEGGCRVRLKMCVR
jgi:hypothetical protein